MQRVAVFVDAGYLFAQGSVLITGTKQGREFLNLDIPTVFEALKTIATETSNQPLLRVYWYDAIRHGRPTPEQYGLADSANIKIRLGQVNSAGEQKGVDALIVTDPMNWWQTIRRDAWPCYGAKAMSYGWRPWRLGWGHRLVIRRKVHHLPRRK